MRILEKILRYTAIALILLFFADWVVFAVRRSRGGGMGSVSVEQYLATPLKGNKAEYDFVGMVDQTCSRTIFPQYGGGTWNTPCWYLQRHHQRWE